MTRFYAALASGGKAPTPYLVRPRSDQVRDLGLSPEQLAGLRRALIAVVETGTASAQPVASTSPSPARPARRRIRTATTTAGSSGSRRRTIPRSSWGASWSSPSTARWWRPYVIKVLHRYVVGPGATDRAPIITLIAPDDSAPRAVQVKPDSVKQIDPVADDTTPPPPPAPSDQ